MLFVSLAIVFPLCFWYYIRKRTMSVLKRCGIPGPKPNLILGNVLQMRNKSIVNYKNDLIKTYGKVVGYYTGAQPTILVTDKELIKRIQTQDFKIFADRPEKDVNFILFEKNLDGNIISATGERWKDTRKMMSPSFSSSKLKLMTPLIDESVDTFIDIMGRNAKKGEEFDFYELVGRLSAEITIKTSFGIKKNIQIGNSIQLYEDIHEFTATPINTTLYLLVNCFPWLFPLVYRIRRIDIFGRKAVQRITNTLSENIKLRRNNPNICSNNILQALLESTIEEKDHSQGKIIQHLTEDEIIANALIVYAGGYDTTSIALATLAHQFVNFPEVQEMVRREVQSLIKDTGRLDFNGIDSELQYLDCVIKETLRLYPPINGLLSRKCLQDYEYQGMTIPQGSTVSIAIESLHHDPEYWPNPKIFDPTRFRSDGSNKIIPFTLQNFGEGPRKCIGMRFAFLVIKFTFAKLLLHYRLEKGPNTEMGEMSTNLGVGTIYPENGVFVTAVEI